MGPPFTRVAANTLAWSSCYPQALLDPMQPQRRYRRVGGQSYTPLGEFEASLKVLQQAEQDSQTLASEYTERCSAAVRRFQTSYNHYDVQRLEKVDVYKLLASAYSSVYFQPPLPSTPIPPPPPPSLCPAIPPHPASPTSVNLPVRSIPRHQALCLPTSFGSDVSAQLTTSKMKTQGVANAVKSCLLDHGTAFKDQAGSISRRIVCS